MSNLDKDLTERIARDLHIPPEKVTTEFIQEWREKHLYPKLKASLGTKYGGFNSVARRVMTTQEIEAQREEAVAILRKLAAIEPE